MKVRLSGTVAVLCAVALALTVPAWHAQAYDPPGTYRVDSSADGHDFDPSDRICGNPSVPGTCTLRGALEEADGDGLHSTILFANPMTITLDQSLGPILEYQAHNSTTIDASAQWDGAWPAGKPGVRLDGPMLVLLQIYGDWVYVHGIEFGTGGIYIHGGTDNWIGGTDPGQRNVFLSPWLGVMTHESSSKASSRNRILGNYFGTVDGITPAPAPAVYGIYLGPGTDHATIEGNLIVNVAASAESAGIELSGATNNTIRGNTIGLDAARTAALPNSYGIKLNQSNQNTIGPGNVIAGNVRDGILVAQSSSGNTIVESTIGVVGLGNGETGVHVSSGPGNAINGSTIMGNNGDGIYLEGGAGNTVTGNVIGGNGGNGLHYGTGMGNTAGNYIGMNRNGADIGNIGYGILVESGGNIIGGSDTISRQWIGFNHKDGIRLSGGLATNCTVNNNMVGLTPGGQEALNGHHGIGVYDAGTGIYIGSMAGPGNVVMGTGWSGIVLVNTSGAWVQRNRVGTTGAGANWGNGYYGIAVVNGSNNVIRNNEIAYSGKNAAEEGIRIQGATSVGNQLTQNSVHDNGGPGITLVDGANAGLAAPVISQGGCGTAAGTACAACTVEVFADNADEGRTYLGMATAGGTGAWSWSGAPGGPYLTATATDAAGDTSPFSAPAPGCRLLSLPLVQRH